MATPDELFDAAPTPDELFDAAPEAPAPKLKWLTAADTQPLNESRAPEAALRGFGQGASYGFSDELEGLVGGGVAGIAKLGRAALQTPPGRALLRQVIGRDDLPDAALDEIAARATSASTADVLGTPLEKSGYASSRDMARRENARAQAENPLAYNAAMLAGGVAAPGPKAGPVRVGGATLKPWAGRALQGAATGAVSGAGMSEGKSLGDVTGDTAVGAGVGAVLAPVVGGALDKAGGGFAKWLEERSRANALKAVGLTPGISNKAKALGYGNADDLLSLGARLRDEGDVIAPFRTPKDAAQRLAGALDESVSAKSAAIDEIERLAQEQGRSFDFNALATRAEGDLRPAQGWDPLSRERAGGAFELLGKASAAQGGFPMAEQVRQMAGKSIPWKAPAFGQALPEDVAMMRRAYGSIAREIQEQAQDVEARSILQQGRTPKPGDLGASDQLAAMNSRISALMDASELANEAATRDVASGSLGLKDLIAGGTLGSGLVASGHPIAGAAVGGASALASRFARDRLPSALTYAQAGLSRTLPGVAMSVEPTAIRAITNETARDATGNAFRALAEKYGIMAKSREELADEAFSRSQTDPALQPSPR